MKIVIAIRHAKAAWTEPEVKDHLRILDQQGVLDAEKLGQFLLQEGIVPDVVLSSSAVRASRTEAIIVENLELPSSIINRKDELYNATAETILSVIQSVDPTKNIVMVVAHNPGISDFVSLVTDGSPVNMGTCDVVIVGFETDEWDACGVGTGFVSRYIENY